MDLDDIKRGLRAEIKKRENEQYATFQCNVRQICKDVLAKLEEQESEIAEKDEKIENLEEYIKELQKATDSAWSKVNAMYDELTHVKRKRCLAMAKVCYLRFVRYENYLQKLCASNATIAAYVFRRDMYDKWEKRWIALAEEPTWVKFLQLIHKEGK